MKLKDFPLIMAGFRAIQQDQPIQGQALNKEAVVPINWEKTFSTAEIALSKIPSGTTLSAIGSEHLPSLKPDWSIVEDDLAIDVVYLPADDADTEVLRYFKVQRAAIKAVQDVFTEFFDGTLRQKFEVRIKGTMGARGPSAKLYEIVDRKDPRVYL